MSRQSLSDAGGRSTLVVSSREDPGHSDNEGTHRAIHFMLQNDRVVSSHLDALNL